MVRPYLFLQIIILTVLNYVNCKTDTCESSYDRSSNILVSANDQIQDFAIAAGIESNPGPKRKATTRKHCKNCTLFTSGMNDLCNKCEMQSRSTNDVPGPSTSQ